MFDWSGLVDRATELFNGGNLAELANGELNEHLSALGIDAEALDGLQVEQLQTMLDDAGIDIASLTEGQLGELVTTVTERGGLDGIDNACFREIHHARQSNLQEIEK